MIALIGVLLLASGGSGSSELTSLALDSAAAPADAIALPMPGGGRITGIVDHVLRPSLSDAAWRGHLEGEPGGWFLLVAHGEDIVGEFASPRLGHVLLRPAGPGRVRSFIHEGDVGCNAVDGHGAGAARQAAAEPNRGVNGLAPIIDIMVVYTPSSRVAAGGTRAIEALVDSYILYTDGAFERSEVAHRFRLVHCSEIAYTESGSSITDLARLRDPGDGHMDAVHALRDEWGADLVSLINTSGSAGTAYVMEELTVDFAWSAFSAIGADTGPIPGGLVFAHETGHNMGLQHNNVAGGPDGLFCYSYGHRTPDDAWRTIMSSSPGTFVDNFSNPDVMFEGQPLGVDGNGCPVGAADAARSLNEAASTVAMFRPTVVPHACLGDLDASGDVGLLDLLQILSAWGDCVGCAQDLDESGDVGLTDLLVVLGAWGSC